MKYNELESWSNKKYNYIYKIKKNMETNNTRIVKNYQELEALVITWAKEKGILDKATPLAQSEKTIEESGELIEATSAQSRGLDKFVNSKGKLVNTQEELKDALGDILVTIIIGAELQGLKLTDCLESAYNVISKRTGVMKDGQFYKDE